MFTPQMFLESLWSCAPPPIVVSFLQWGVNFIKYVQRNPEVSSIKSFVGIQLHPNWLNACNLRFASNVGFYVANQTLCVGAVKTSKCLAPNTPLIQPWCARSKWKWAWKWYLDPKNDDEKWSRKSYFEIPPCAKLFLENHLYILHSKWDFCIKLQIQ